MDTKKQSAIFLFFSSLLVISSLFLHFRQKNIISYDHPQGVVLAEATEKQSEPNIYRNDTYGFQVNYPGDWVSPQEETVNDPDYNYIFRASFGTDQGFRGETAEGFNVFVYRGNACLSNGDSVSIQDKNPDAPLAHSIANNSQIQSGCVSRKVTVNGSFFPHEINIFQYVGTNYSFVLVPFISRNEALPEHITAQFEEAAKSFDVLAQDPISPPPAVNQKIPPKISPQVKKPTAMVRPQGTMVCPDPKQKPAYSKTKGKHMDEDCCPDPDEWPNPQCIYPTPAFKIMLSGPPAKKK